jgi:Polysaccharide lyase
MLCVIACAAVKFPVFNVQKEHRMAISQFSGTNGANILIDETGASVQNANQPWSLTEPDANTLGFSLHSGDVWSQAGGGWNDLTMNNAAERSEIAVNGQNPYAAGTQINVSYQLMIEPGAANTAPWLSLSQFHETPANGPGPFGIELDGEHMRIRAAIGTGSSGPTVVWEDPNPIQRGHYYDMNIQVKFDPSGNGFLNVWRDGVQIVNYQGPIGYGGQSYYFKEGVYRGPAPETMTANFRELHITTGAASAPTAPTQPQPTDPTSPTTPTSPITTSPTIPPRTSTSPTTPTTPTAPTTPTTPTTSRPSVTTPVLTVTAAPQAITATNDARSTDTPTASLANQSFALLNQHLAGSTSRFDAGQIVASASNGATAGQVSFLTRPQH